MRVRRCRSASASPSNRQAESTWRRQGRWLELVVPPGSCGSPAVVDRCESTEGQRAEHEAEVADGDVVPLAVAEQVDDDPREPRGDDVGAVAGAYSDDDRGEDLDAAYHVHDVVRGAAY